MSAQSSAHLLDTPEVRTVSRPLWRAAQAFRAATVLYAVGVQLTTVEQYQHQALSWALIAILLAWSGIAVVGFTIAGRKRVLVWVDQIVTLALIFSSWAVAPVEFWAHRQSLPTTMWVANAVVSMAIWGGARWGLASGIAMGLACTAVTRDASNLWLDASMLLLAIVGLALGVGSTALRSARAQLEQAIRVQAATAERERLARDVHDGALQVLALMRRRGAGAPGDLGELATLAGKQEVALRRLLVGAPASDRADARLDVRAELATRLPPQIEPAGPAEPVLLPAPAAHALLAAALQAVTNADQHAGADASVFVLVEDLGDEVVVTVRDDGVGTTPEAMRAAAAAGHLGVSQSIEARIREAGGEAHLFAAPGEGVEWELRVPRLREDGDHD